MHQPTPAHQLYLDSLAAWMALHRNQPAIQEQLALYQDVVDQLAMLDLGLAAHVFDGCYAARRRGSPRKDPLAMFRMLLTGILIDRPNPNGLVPYMRYNPVLRAICGFFATDDEAVSPGIGTTYDFMNRIVDGPARFQPGVEWPSRTLSALAKMPMTKDQRKHALDEKKSFVEGKSPEPVKEEGRKRVEQATSRLREYLKTTIRSPLEEMFIKRLLEILTLVAIKPSAERGLLGDVTKLVVSGDGSPLYSATNGHGKRVPACTHGPHERCDCPRTWSDPDASSGWDSFHKRWFYGYNFYEICSVASKHQLPLFISISPGGTNDQIAGMRDLATYSRFLLEQEAGWSVDIFIGDKGHDGGPFFTFLAEDLEIRTVIPLCAGIPAFHPKRPDLPLSAENAIPLCEAKAEMAAWGSSKPGVNLFICPVKAGKIERCPKSREGEPSFDCRPALKYGPAVKVNVKDSARLFPDIVLDSPTGRKLYRKRSTSERSNAAKKGVGGVDRTRYRRSTWHLLHLYLLAMLQHAKAWLQEDRQTAKKAA